MRRHSHSHTDFPIGCLSSSSSLLASGPEQQSVLTEEIHLHENRPLCFEEHLQSVDGETLKRTCVDFTLLGYFRIELELCDTDVWMWTSTLGLSLSPLSTVIGLGYCTRSVS